MRMFQNCLEAIKEIERDLFEMGTLVHPETMQDKNVAKDDNFQTTELTAYAYAIINGGDRDQMLEYMSLPIDYADQEIEDRLNTNSDWDPNPGNSWKIRREVWKQFLHDGKFSYTYNERLHSTPYGGTDGQLNLVIEQLRQHPNTRQAIVQIYDAFLDVRKMGGNARIPCSILYQFMIRNGRLDVHYYQRSADFLNHLPYDIWLTLALRDHVAQELGIEPGNMYHYIASLHAYYGDMKKRGIF